VTIEGAGVYVLNTVVIDVVPFLVSVSRRVTVLACCKTVSLTVFAMVLVTVVVTGLRVGPAIVYVVGSVILVVTVLTMVFGFDLKPEIVLVTFKVSFRTIVVEIMVVFGGELTVVVDAFSVNVIFAVLLD